MGSEYGQVDKVNALRGLMDTFFVLYPQWQGIDFRRTAERLDVPVYLFVGDHELAGRRSLALEWYRLLSAPCKHLYRYADAGHATAFEHADDLRRILARRAP
jgi:pimeloyl-ACP methyl ester carboxylesterase